MRYLLTRVQANPAGELTVHFAGGYSLDLKLWRHLFPRIMNAKGQSRETTDQKAIAYAKGVNNTFQTQASIHIGLWEVVSFPLLSSKRHEVQAYDSSTITTDIAKIARTRITPEGSFVQVPWDVHAALQGQLQTQKLASELYTSMATSKTPKYLRHELLEEVFETRSSNAIEQLQRMAPQNLQTIDSLTQILHALPHTSKLAYNKGVVRAQQLSDTFSYLYAGVFPTFDQLSRLPSVFLDIEVPLFRRPDAQISWVRAVFTDEGRSFGQVHTLHKLAKDITDVAYVYPNQDELISGLARKIKQFSPKVYYAYNGQFDFRQLTNEGDFVVSHDNKTPLVRSSAQFLTRIGVNHALVIDPHRVHTLGSPASVNHKLEVSARIEKSIDYDEMEKLELEALAGNQASAMKIYEYLRSDVDELVGLVQKPWFKRTYDQAVSFASQTKISLERTLHSFTSAKDLEEKQFYHRHKVLKSDAIPASVLPRNREEREQALASVLLHIKKASPVGFLPVAYWSIPPISQVFFPILSEMYPQVRPFEGNTNPQIEQYLFELTKPILEAYGIATKLASVKYPHGFEDLVVETYTQLRAQGVRKAGDVPKLYKTSVFPLFEDYAKSQDLSLEGEQSLSEYLGFRIRCEQHLQSTRLAFNAGFSHIKYLHSMPWRHDLSMMFKSLQSIIEQHHPIAWDGACMVTKNPVPLLVGAQGPVYTSDKLYFEDMGYLHLWKEDAHIRASSIESNYGAKIIRSLLENNLAKARTFSAGALDAIATNPSEELVCVTKDGMYIAPLVNPHAHPLIAEYTKGTYIFPPSALPLVQIRRDVLAQKVKTRFDAMIGSGQLELF